MVPTNPPCCVLVPPVSYLLGLDEEILDFRKAWDSQKMAEIIPRERMVERVRSLKLRSKLVLLNFFGLNNFWYRWADAQCYFENSLLTAERAGLPVAASERAQPASLPQCADLCCWLGGVRGGFSVLSSDCQKRRLFSILDLRNFKSRWTRNLDLITGPKLPSSRRLDCWGYILQYIS